MFEIKEITVTASCSKNYQKAEFTMTAMVENDQDIAAVKSLCTQHALQLLETLPIKEEPKQPVLAPRPPYQNQGFNPQPRPQQYQNTEPRKASDKQINYLRSFGWNGNPNITWDQANQLLQQYKLQNGIR